MRGYRVEPFNPSRRPATPRQREIYDFIVAHEGHPPSLRDIAEAFNFSKEVARFHITNLVRKGWLTRRKHKARNAVPRRAQCP